MIGSALEVENLGISFGGVKAVDGVSFTAARNRITTIIGPNGAGKSTLFNLISGALRPHVGVVRLNGEPLTAFSPARARAAGLARSFQITNLFLGLSVFENLRLAAQLLEPPARAYWPLRRSALALAKVDELLERFQLSPKAAHLVGQLSHGEQRRLEIAVCLASNPKLLLLDEPTQGMSHGDTQESAELIASLRQDVTVVLIEHDIGLVMSLSDHVVVMQSGRKLAEGPPDRIRADPAVQTAYLGHA